MRTRLLLNGFLGFLLLGVSLSCVRKESTLSSDLVRIRLRGEPESLHWTRSVDINLFRVLPLFAQSLLELPREGEPARPQPGVALSWEERVPHQDFYFELNPHAKWSDGKSVTAEDFRRVLLWMLDGKNASPAYSLFYGTLTAKGIYVLSPTQLRLRLRRPAPYFLWLMTVLWPVREEDLNSTARLPVLTNGPYQLAHWNEQGLLFTRRDNVKTGIKQILFRVVEEDATAVRLYETGELDMVETPNHLDVLRYEKNNRSDLKLYPSMRTHFLALNPRSPLFRTHANRQRVLSALDQTDLARLRFPLWVPAFSWVPEDLFETSLRNLLTLKWPKTTANTGSGLEFELAFGAREDQRLLAEALEAQWRTAGISARLWSLEYRAYQHQRQAPTTEAFLASWGGSYAHPYTFLEVFLPGGPFGFLPNASASYVQQVLSSDAKDWAAASRWLSHEEAIIGPLIREKLAYFIRPGISGLQVSVAGRVDYSQLKRD